MGLKIDGVVELSSKSLDLFCPFGAIVVKPIPDCGPVAVVGSGNPVNGV